MSMAKQRELTKRQRNWLHKRHADLDHQTMADKLGCCVDTLKRILMREGLQYFAGAKYQFKMPETMWDRPCTLCGDQKRRPINQYRCTHCHEKEALSSRMSFGEEEEGYREPSLPKPPFDISNFFIWGQSYG